MRILAVITLLSLSALTVETSVASTEAQTAQQFCLQSDEGPACFLEVITDGRSRLFTTESSYEVLVLDERLVAANLEFEPLAEAVYVKELTRLQPNSFMYSEDQIDVYDYESLSCFRPIDFRQPICQRPPHPRPPSPIPSIFGGAGQVSRGSSFCGSTIYAHIAGQTYDVSESASWRPVRMCR